ncbi:hypothetical protein Pst134EA_011102 [Puccinia striiformis f. sp. tritici]|uniref:hypothetical protein n=1 Tax=Puccinia striiformis f. sp. tritici TaxID=168172 RepID=UPI0020072822|nr:hypothetical protein Pst134EA_011102 [Puccinia striiformis f. sp. tritici]KAH9467458.1 hypothetical protein Pst134EA_011102 [Puccinia striiformis f. sp. tritici]
MTHTIQERKLTQTNAGGVASAGPERYMIMLWMHTKASEIEVKHQHRSSPGTGLVVVRVTSPKPQFRHITILNHFNPPLPLMDARESVWRRSECAETMLFICLRSVPESITRQLEYPCGLRSFLS